MNTIPQVKSWPNDALVEAIQGKIAKVYDQRTVGGAGGPKTVQNAELVDAGNNKIRIAVWEHPDLKPLEGKEVVIQSGRSGNGRAGGVKVAHGSFVAKKDGPNYKAGETVNTIELSVSKAGTFQLVEVYRANNPNSGQATPPAATQTTEANGSSVQSASTVIHGATVGMAINQACSWLTHQGAELSESKVWEVASRLIRVARKMDKGELHTPENPSEDVPY